MTQQSEPQDTETVVDSYPTEGKAWEQAHEFALILKRKGLAKSMGVTVKPMAGAWVIILVKRG